MKTRTRTLKLIIFLITVVVLSACSGENNADNAVENVSLKIGTMPSIDAFPLVVAKENGYFTNHNLDVEIVVFQSPVERDAALQSGQIDGTVTDIVSAALVLDGGTDVKITSVTSGVTPAEGPFAIMAAPNSGIQSVADLKGKSIGVSTNTVIEYVTEGLIVEGGLAPNDVEMTMVAKIPLRMEMVLNGQIAAGTFPEPMITYLESKGAVRVADDTNTDLSQAVLVMTDKAIQEKSNGLKRFYTAYAEAVQSINKEPEKYRELFVKEVRVPDEVKTIIEVPTFSAPQNPTEAQVNNVLQWLNKKALLQSTLNYSDLVKDGLY